MPILRQKSPDVLLELEHIKPVSKGGSNDIINLTTACTECNAGKSDRELSDNSVVEKQRRQLEQLQERREQLEMMMEWHEGLTNHSDYEVEKFVSYFNKIHGTDIGLSDTGKSNAKKHIKKYGFPKLLEAVDVLKDKYFDLEIEEKFKKIGGILYYLSANEDEKQVMYIKGICRNRFAYFDFVYGPQLIREALRYYKYDYIVQVAKTERNWTNWSDTMEEAIAQAKSDHSNTTEDSPF